MGGTKWNKGGTSKGTYEKYVHVSPSLWSNVSKVKSFKDRSLKVFSKCICHCLCHFVGHVMFSHDPHQFCEDGVWSGRLECFESNTISEWVSDQGRPRAARAAAKNKNPFSVFLGPQIMKKKCDHCLTIIYIHFENNRNCFWSPKNKKSDLNGNMPYKRNVLCSKGGVTISLGLNRPVSYTHLTLPTTPYV